MADAAGTIERAAIEFSEIVQGLADRLHPESVLETFARMGVAFPTDLLAHAGFESARSSLASAARALGPSVQALITAIEAEDVPGIIAQGAAVLTETGNVVSSFQSLADQLQAAAPGLPGIAPAQVADLIADFPRKLLDLLLIEQIDAVPGVGATLTVLGIIERVHHAGDSADPTRPPFDALRLRLDRIFPLLTDPTGYFQTTYDWGAAGFDGSKLFPVLHDAITRLGLPARLIPAAGPEPWRLEAFAVDMRPTSSGSPPGIELDVVMPVRGDVDVTIPLPHPAWSAKVVGSASLRIGTSGTLRPPISIELAPPTGQLTGDATLSVIGAPAEPFVLLGAAGGSRLEVKGIEVGGGATFQWSSASGRAAAEPTLRGRISGGKLVIDSSEGDGFLSQILSGVGVQASFDLGFEWAPSTGIRFAGSSALEIEIPVNLDLGPISLPTIYLGGRLDGDRFALDLASAIAARLGPLDAVVDRMGVTASLSFPSGGGNVGPAQIDFDFKPPTGVGLSIDTGVITGGGFLNIDTVNERYEGVLQLSFKGLFSMTAIGLITTRMPDGSSGFSLLILISAEFTPIQLGFGFTLNGVGGLLGLHRTIVVDALRDGIKNNAVDHIMFPDDPVANAPRIISDLRTIFPPFQDQFLVGPMGKLGWGTPTLISLEVGVIVELPDPVRIAILGVLEAILPDQDAALLKLQINFVGIIDFEAGELSFDASLYDSRLLFLTLSGGMAFRLRWGDDPSFLLSVGGFHPAYDPPDLDLPVIDRLTISLLPTGNPRLTLETYFAVTSNTVQFGARLELYAGVSSFNVYGWLGFDVLFQFSPFQFIAEISAGLAVRVGTSPILGVDLRLTLSGPTPWHAKGRAKFKILFFSFKVKFSVTWGDERDTRLPDIEVLPLLLEALGKSGNWYAETPSRSSMLVTMRTLPDPGDDVIVHPFGRVTVRQKLLPLGIAVQKYGAAKIADGERFVIDSVRTNGTELDTDEVRDEFAPAQYFDLKDSDKLSRKSFEKLQGGVKIGSSDEISAGTVVTRVVEYEQHVIDAKPRILVAFLQLTVGRFLTFLRGNAMAQSTIAQSVRPAGSALSPGKVSVVEEGYTVVSTEDLGPVDGVSAGLSQAEALDRMQTLVADDPSRAGELQVVASYEVAR